MINNNDYSIQTLGLTKKFGSFTAVDGVDLAIKKGELFSLLGPNGAGKTTMIKMLCCLLAPTDGTALIMGHDIKDNYEDVKQIINISPQETAVASHLTILENLELIGGVYGFTKTETIKKAKYLMNILGLGEKAGSMVKNLSGGMQRRLSIAMALMSDPQILFLDEPTLSLDPQARNDLWKEIQKLKGEKTIILTTHYLEEADMLSDRIAIIKNGKIVALGTPDELKNNLNSTETMIIKANNITDTNIKEIKLLYPDIKITENQIEIKGRKIDFDTVVDSLRSKGIKIERVTMKEPSLDCLLYTSPS